MVMATDALHFGKNWHSMLKHLADSEIVVDVYLCSNAFGNPDDRERMIEETHGVRIIYVGEDYFIVGPKRPVHSSVIPMGWISMIRVHGEGDSKSIEDLIDLEDGELMPSS
ncbi:MAG: hypothetical protein ACW97A_02195 [Candidatus Thorarchaeota archaeon]